MKKRGFGFDALDRQRFRLAVDLQDDVFLGGFAGRQRSPEEHLRAAMAGLQLLAE